MLYFLGKMIQVYNFCSTSHIMLPKQVFHSEAQETGAMQEAKASGPQSTALGEKCVGLEAVQP